MATSKVKYVVYGDETLSLKTGKPVNIYNKKGTAIKPSYIRYPAVGTKDSFLARKAAKSKVASGNNRKKAKEDYNQTMGAYIPEHASYIAKTQKGGDRRVGSSKDSYINAINKSFMAVTQLPLTTKNRKVLSEVYADEMSAAFNSAGNAFANRKAEFDLPKNQYIFSPFQKGKGKGSGTAQAQILSGKKHAERKALFSGVRQAPGFKNPWLPEEI